MYDGIPLEVRRCDDVANDVPNASGARTVDKNDCIGRGTEKTIQEGKSYSIASLEPPRSDECSVHSTCDELSVSVPYSAESKTFESAPTITTRTVTTTETVTTTTVTVKSSNTTSTITAPHTPLTDSCTILSESNQGNQGSDVISPYRSHPHTRVPRGSSEVSVKSSTGSTEHADMTTRRGSRPILYSEDLSDDESDLLEPRTLSLHDISAIAIATAAHPSKQSLYSRNLNYNNPNSSYHFNPSTSRYSGSSGRPHPSSDRRGVPSESSFDTTAGQLGDCALTYRTHEENKRVLSASLPYMLCTQSSRQRDNSMNFSNSTPCLAQYGAIPSSSRGN